MLENYEKILFELSKKAFKKGEVPVSALIVRNNKVIAKAYNKRFKTGNPLYHAEIQCIIKATKKLGDWRLSDCELYVTLEPCHMCREIIMESRIKKVYYFTSSEKHINFKTEFERLKSNVIYNYDELLTNFFRNIR